MLIFGGSGGGASICGVISSPGFGYSRLRATDAGRRSMCSQTAAAICAWGTLFGAVSM